MNFTGPKELSLNFTLDKLLKRFALTKAMKTIKKKRVK